MTDTETETGTEFESFQSLPEAVKRGVEDLGWKEPMPVQRRVIPMMLAGRDLIVQAITGSGKTGAFGLPIAEKLVPEQRNIQDASGREESQAGYTSLGPTYQGYLRHRIFLLS